MKTAAGLMHNGAALVLSVSLFVARTANNLVLVSKQHGEAVEEVGAFMFGKRKRVPRTGRSSYGASGWCASESSVLLLLSCDLS
jgi:hypothetical protein